MPPRRQRTKHATMTRLLLVPAALSLIATVQGFVPQQTNKIRSTKLFAEKKGWFGNFMEELDAFVDDATSGDLAQEAPFTASARVTFMEATIREESWIVTCQILPKTTKLRLKVDTSNG
jgi:hypothetical protein